MYRGTQDKQAVTGDQNVPLNEHAVKHTVCIEKVGVVTGLVAVTVRGHTQSNAQAINNNQIDLNAPKPVFFEGSFAEVVLSPTVGTDVFNFSVSSAD